MSARGRTVAFLAAVAVALAVPSVASAHAYLIKTVPVASGVLAAPPPNVALTYDEAVEPRFAIISVTNASGQQETTGSPTRSPANPDTLVVALRAHLPEGWYLVYWRAISVDGHPVQGAFTYAVGPNPGPAPQFKVPSIASSATSPNLLITRWVMFLSVMVAIGLFAFRFAIARPLTRRVPGASLRPVSIAFVTASVVGVIAIPVYLDFAIANDSLRSVFDISALVPLFRVTAFGRGYADMTLCFGLFCVAGWVSLWLDHPEREGRSIAEIVAQTGAVAAAAATLIIPGTSGHAGQQSPRGFSLLFDWLHLVSGSLWLGGLVGLLVLWFAIRADSRVAALSTVVPRFSNVALVSVLALIGSGIGQSLLEVPTLASLWQTSYGQALLWKIGLLTAALVLASVNLARTKPRLEAAQPGAAFELRRFVSGEIVLVVGALFAAAVLTSLPPPSSALASVKNIAARVGPGPVSTVVTKGPYKVRVRVTPNRAAVQNDFSVTVTKNGKPVPGAQVITQFDMLDMQMGQQSYKFDERAPGTFSKAAPALVMVGHWALQFQVTPPGAQPFIVTLLDKAGG